jgi:hypothetical protein
VGSGNGGPTRGFSRGLINGGVTPPSSLAHGRGWGHGRGTPERRYVADLFDARCKTGTAPDAFSVMRYPTRASELVSPTSKAPHLHPYAMNLVLRTAKAQTSFCGLGVENGHQSVAPNPRPL